MSHVHNWTVLIGSPRGRAEMQPAEITQAENEGGTVLRKQIRAPYLKNADKQDPEMPTTLGSEPEPGSWHESEREGALSVGTQGMESGPPGLQTFPIGTTSFQNLCVTTASSLSIEASPEPSPSPNCPLPPLVWVKGRQGQVMQVRSRIG